MNRTKRLTIACLIVTALILITLAVLVLSGAFTWNASESDSDTGWPFSFGGSVESLRGTFEEQGNYTIPSDDIRNLDVNWAAGDITVLIEDTQEITITEYARRTLTDEESLRLSTQGAALTIDYTKTSNLRIVPEKRLELSIPAALANQLQSVALDTSSGDITLSSLECRALVLDTFSGAIAAQDVSAEHIALSSSSGDILLTDAVSTDCTLDTFSGNIQSSTIDSASFTASSSSGDISTDILEGETCTIDTFSGTIQLTDISGDSLTLDSSSGDISIQGGAYDQVTAETFSGSLSLEGIFDILDTSSSSGDISLTSSTEPSDIQAETFSGNVTLVLPDADPLSVIFDSFSGTFTSDLPVTHVSSEARITVKTSSGDLTLRPY